MKRRHKHNQMTSMDKKRGIVPLLPPLPLFLSLETQERLTHFPYEGGLEPHLVMHSVDLLFS